MYSKFLKTHFPIRLKSDFPTISITLFKQTTALYSTTEIYIVTVSLYSKGCEQLSFAADRNLADRRRAGLETRVVNKSINTPDI